MTARTDRSDPKSLFPCIRDGAKRIVQAKGEGEGEGRRRREKAKAKGDGEGEGLRRTVECSFCQSWSDRKCHGKNVVLIALLALAAVSLAVGFKNGLRFVDFHWESAALFLRGENPYQWYFDGRFFQGTYVDATQAPSTIAFILPYGFFSHYVGNLLWGVSNLVFLAVFWFFVWRTFFADRPYEALVLFAVFAMGDPCRVCIGNGQHALMSLAYFAAAYWAMERKKSFWLVGFLMAGSLFKYTFAVPLAFIFLFRRQWRAMAVCAGIHIGLTLALGWWTHSNPVDLVLQSMKVGSATAMGSGEADWASLAHWLGVADVGGIALVGYAVFGAVLFTLSFAGGKDSLLKLATFAVIANVMFYHSIYDFVTLVFPLIYVALHREDRAPLDRAIRYLTYANVVFAFFIHKIFFILQSSALIPIGFALEHALLACLIWKGMNRKASPLLFTSVLTLAFAGCSLFRPNPLHEGRGAVVLVFDTRTAGDLKDIRQTLLDYDARATVFASGQIGRGTALALKDFESDGHEIGLSGLKGVDLQHYAKMFGQQKYFQDEILTQFIDAERQGLNPRYYLLRYPSKMKAEALAIPPFLVSKGFACVVDLMPDYVSPRAVSVSALNSPSVLHAYQLTEKNFDRAQIASLASRNEILVVSPNRRVLPALLAEAQAQGVPFATVGDCREGMSGR